MSYTKTQKEMAPCERVHQPNEEGLYEASYALNSRCTERYSIIRKDAERREYKNRSRGAKH